VRESAIAFVHFGDFGLMKDAVAGLCSVAPHLGVVMNIVEQHNCQRFSTLLSESSLVGH